MPLKQVMNSFDGLIADIYAKRDYVIKQMKDKECISTAHVKILVNAMIHQIVDDKDIKPELSLLEKVVSRDPHQCFKDDIERERGLRIVLDAKVKELDSNLQLELKQKNEFRLLYEDCLRTSLRNELQYKIDIESKNKEIEELKSKLSSLAEKNDEQSLRQRCLASKPFVVLDNNIRSIEYSDHSSSPMQTDANDAQIDNVSDHSDVDIKPNLNQIQKQRTRGRPKKIKPIEIVIDEYYSRIETRSGIKYKCEWHKCRFKSLAELDIIKHIKFHKSKNPFICDGDDGCGKAFLDERHLMRHKQIHSPVLQHMKSRLDNIVDNRSASNTSSNQLIECDLEDSDSSDVCEYIGVKHKSTNGNDYNQMPNDYIHVSKRIKTEVP